MRTTLALVALVTALSTAVLVGCRTQPLDHPIVDDFGTIVTHDLAGNTKIDMSVVTGDGCGVLVGCLFSCADEQCQNECYNNSSNDAQNLFNDVISCLYDHCLQRIGMRPPPCIQDRNGNLVDRPDAGVGVCDRCLNNVFAELGNYPCQPADDPDCSPQECSMTVQECLQM